MSVAAGDGAGGAVGRGVRVEAGARGVAGATGVGGVGVSVEVWQKQPSVNSSATISAARAVNGDRVEKNANAFIGPSLSSIQTTHPPYFMPE